MRFFKKRFTIKQLRDNVGYNERTGSELQSWFTVKEMNELPKPIDDLLQGEDVKSKEQTWGVQEELERMFHTNECKCEFKIWDSDMKQYIFSTRSDV
jgi:hypothetical protein